jgi:hypothetical protein
MSVEREKELPSGVVSPFELPQSSEETVLHLLAAKWEKISCIPRCAPIGGPIKVQSQGHFREPN